MQVEDGMCQEANIEVGDMEETQREQHPVQRSD